MDRPEREVPAAPGPGTSAAPGTSIPGNLPRRGSRPWGTVVGFGLVSLATDIVSDGARPLAGPLLAQLGASALLVGLVTGGAEAAAQGLRVIFGPWADRTRKYWTFTLAGYAMTALCVPLLAFAPAVGAAGLGVASVLIIGDRVGKAVRSPAKTVLLAAATKDVGRGRGFAVHKSLDLTGALLGPVIVAAVLAATGLISAAFAALAVPAAAALALLLWLRRRLAASDGGNPAAAEVRPPAVRVAGVDGDDDGGVTSASGSASLFSGVFLPFAVCAFFWSAGLVAFGVISYHLTAAAAVAAPVVPLLYAAAMGAAVLGALGSGFLYDRVGPAVLLALPPLIAAVPVLAFSTGIGLVLAGVAIWGTATGIQDSTVKALVADLVPEARQGSAYGVFAAFEGAGALAGGALYGALYDARPALIAGVAALQAVALVLLTITVRRARPSRQRRRAPDGPGQR
ncbi:MFS transporter [Arthrobacter sp. UKPF54-2]|uniref:MFS transporter n=1 Tax=Arthrobacter sp. UKPF54-2 TaxID=2600159 RepID=UPI0011B11617|nr:MFS transporter [Arthrobacter sp. UKPF54-2]QDY89260.1 MFS transporter [Arthrobacter sp. UKPF54-2]